MTTNINTQSKEYILFEASREGIKSLVDTMSTSISFEAKRTKMLRIIDELQVAYENTK